MKALPYMLAAVIVGATISTQPALNAILARAIGSAFVASAISIAIALLGILAVLAVVGVERIAGDTFTAVPWWVYLAGLAGTVFVVGGVIIAPVTGALAFFVCIVAGQMIGSVIADHYGAFGLEIREVSVMRLLGIALVLLGAIMVTRW